MPKRTRFLEACRKYKQACGNEDLVEARRWRVELEGLRVKLCDSCNELASKLSPAQQVCKDELYTSLSACARRRALRTAGARTSTAPSAATGRGRCCRATTAPTRAYYSVSVTMHASLSSS